MLEVIDNIERLLAIRDRSYNWLVNKANQFIPDEPRLKLRLSNARFTKWKKAVEAAREENREVRSWPKPIHLVAIARALDVPLEILLSEDPTVPVPSERSEAEQKILRSVLRDARAFGLEEALLRLAANIPDQPSGHPPTGFANEDTQSKNLEIQDIRQKRRAGRPRKPRDPGDRKSLPKMFLPEPEPEEQPAEDSSNGAKGSKGGKDGSKSGKKPRVGGTVKKKSEGD